MPRNVSIRISQNDKQDYQRLVRNAKAKIRRVKKKYNRELSSSVELPSLSTFKSRKQYNEWKNEIKSFTSRGNTKYQFVKNKYDVTISKKEVYELKELTKEAQRLYDTSMPNVVDLKMNKGSGTVGQRMQQMKTETLKPREFNINNYRSMVDVKRDFDRLRKKNDDKYYDELIERMRDNYISKLKYTYHDDADSLIKMLNEMPLNHFYALFKINEGGVFDFDIYDSEQSVKSFGSVSTDGMPMDDLLSAMMTEVESYNQGNYDMDFANLIN